MGKLNYINRKIDGLKLGQVVNKDLIKRIPPHTNSKAALRDPVIELDVSGKNLTDEGLYEVASALVEALCYNGDQGKVARLEELCLRSNQITIRSLQALTPVIGVTCHDLRELDLSENEISVKTEDDVAIWENFLTSFKDCCVLRKIDFSGNVLGDRAFEVLLRVYAKESPVDLLSRPELTQAQHEEQSQITDVGGLIRKTKKVVLGSDADQYAAEGGYSKRKASKQESKSPEKTSVPALPARPLPIHSTTRGLRSVPYIVLRSTAMTDTCALHLSYIITQHHKPEQLLTRVPAAKAGSHVQLLIDYDSHPQCQGIIYLPNDTLGSTGLKVLELADAVRNIPVDGTTGELPELLHTPIKSNVMPKQVTNVYSSSPLVGGGKRRQSSFSAEEGVEAEEARSALIAVNLDRARSRIQGDTLQAVGPLSNDLWRVALKMLCLGRNIQLQVKEPPPVPKAKAPIIKTLTVPGNKPKTLTLKSAMPLTLERDSNRAVMPWGSFPQKSSSIPPTPTVTPPTPLPQMTFGSRAELSLAGNETYRTKLPCGFTDELWRQILALAAGADGIMSQDQQRSMLRWAMNRETLSKESEILGLTLASQIWRILEGTSCLTYEMDI